MTPIRAKPASVLQSRVIRGVLILWVLLSEFLAQADPSELPQLALLPNPNPLCDSNLVPCLDIDKYAAHVYADLMVLPKTDLRDTAVVFPYGVTLGVFGRFAGGISTSSSFWQQDGALQHQQGPLRLNLMALLWPLLPLSQAPTASQEQDGGTHFSPPRRLRIGISYEHQWRVGPFDGANSLGLSQDLAALRLVAVKVFGPAELTASLGALYDWRGTFATGEAGAQVGFYLPFFKSLKVYAEALGRGTPAYIKKDALPLVDGLEPLHPQAVIGGGLSFRPSERVDLGVSIQRGFGGLAPLSVLVRFLTLSIGETYQHRAATPVVQLAADATASVAKVIKDYLATLPIDPWLDRQCLLWDDNGRLLFPQPVGTRTADGQHCLVQGELLPIGQTLWRDRKKSLVCRDEKFADCLLYRRHDQLAYSVLHRPWVGADCVLRERIYDPQAPSLPQGETHRVVKLAVLGSLTDDKQGCRDETGHVHPVGTSYYREHNHTWICTAPRIEEQRDRCFMALAELPSQMQNQTTPVGRIARALDHGMVEEALALDKVPDQVVETAEGIDSGRINAGTARDALKDAAFSFAHHFTREGVRETWESLEKFARKPAIEQAEVGSHGLGSAIIGAPVSATVGVVTDGVGGALWSGARRASELAKIGKATEKAGGAAVKSAKRLAGIDRKVVQQGAERAAEAAPKGGTYMLIDSETGQVMRTGRTKDLERRKLEHRRDPETAKHEFEIDRQTDSYPEMRGREQVIHDLYKPPLNKVNPISPRNLKRKKYLEAAKKLEQDKD